MLLINSFELEEIIRNRNRTESKRNEHKSNS